jgi:hypothetical protein
MMSLTKSDLKDATMLLKAGNIDAVRSILGSSSDPRALALLAKIDARFPAETDSDSAAIDYVGEIKRLLAARQYDEAETLIRSSDHPDAERLLQKIARLKLTAKAAEKPKPRSRSVWKYISVMMSSLRSTN